MEGPSKWVEAKEDTLIQSAKTAIDRSRKVFLLINLAGVLILSAEFNARFSWLWIELKLLNNSPEVKKTTTDLIIRDLQTFSTPLLGNKLSVFDLEVTGTIAIVVLTAWFWFALRRENHVTGLVREAIKRHLASNRERAEYLFYAVTQNFIFTRISRSDEPVHIGESRLPRNIFFLLFFLPTIVIAFVILIEFSSLFRPVYPEVLLGAAALPIFEGLDFGERVEVFARTGLGLGLLIAVLRMCIDCWKFNQQMGTKFHQLYMELYPVRVDQQLSHGHRFISFADSASTDRTPAEPGIS